VYKGQSKIDVQLKTSAIALEEVVAIGYEVKKKSVVTGAISSIDSDDLLQSKPANAVNALSGRVSGVNVVTNSGQPGSAPKLVIRGVGTNRNLQMDRSFIEKKALKLKNSIKVTKN
jgi:outer membrane cobalamin receptor